MLSISKPKIILLILAVLVVAGIVGYQMLHKKPATEQAANTPGQFQPEGNLLTQATDADKNATNADVDKSVCANSSSMYLCFADYYKTLTQKSGATVAIADMKARYAQNPLVASDCHPLMHVVGRTAAASYTNASDAFAHGDVFCWSGYYHGIMEGLVGKIGLKNLPTQLDNICAEIPGKASYNFNYYNCVHGLGHGVMALLGDDVFASLKMCDNLTGSWEEQSCYGGTFMQNIIDSTNVADTDNVVKDLRPTEPLYPCTAVDDKYKGQCYLGQTSYALQVSAYNFQKVFALCTTVAEPYRDICFQSLGRDGANQATHDAQRTKTTCWIATNANDRMNCVVGAVKEIISYYHAKTQAVEFCNILEADKTQCNAVADSYYAQL